MLWRARSRSSPGPWSRGLPLGPGTSLLYSPPTHSSWGLLTAPGWLGPHQLSLGLPTTPQAALLHQTLMTSSSKRLRALDLGSQTLALSCSLPQPSSFMEDLACAPHLTFCLLIAVNTSQCSLIVPSGFCVSREGHRTFWCYWLFSLEN